MTALSITQGIVSVILIALILLQQRGAEGLGSSFGGESFAASYSTRRGAEKIIFIATILLAAAFIALAVFSVFIS